jgi:hypothetical protein
MPKAEVTEQEIEAALGLSAQREFSAYLAYSVINRVGYKLRSSHNKRRP